MNQTNHQAQTNQDCEYHRHIDQHNDERIRCHRMSHQAHLISLPGAILPYYPISEYSLSLWHKYTAEKAGLFILEGPKDFFTFSRAQMSAYTKKKILSNIVQIFA